MLVFEVFLPLKKPLVTVLTETRAFTFQNYDVKKGDVPMSSKNTNYFGRTSSFCLKISASKMSIFEICLPLTEPLVVTFSKTREHTSRKYVVVQGMSFPKSSEKFKLLWLHSSIFALE